MTKEENIQQELIGKFNYLADKIKIKRDRRIFLEIDQISFKGLLEYTAKNLNFSTLCAITGLDEQTSFGIIYHLSQESGIMINIKINIPRENPVIDSIISYFPNSEIYEREMIDLLGIKVNGLPAGNRYPLPDNWPDSQYPLRKDWKKG